MNEDFLRWVAEKSWAAGVCQSVCLCVCPSISGHSARTAGPIGTGVAPIDAPKRRNGDGAGRRSAGGTWLVARAAACKLAKKIARTYRSNGGHRRSQTSRSYVYHPNLSAFGVAVPEGRRLHAPGEENFFDMGSSGSRKL